MIRIHGTAVALRGAGVLLRGPSGSGKSDLALRLIDAGAVLVADDQTELYVVNGQVAMRPPVALAGRIEVRGIGIIATPWRPDVPLRLVADLVPPIHVERMPEPAFCRFLDRTFPLVAVAPFEASAPMKLRLLLRRLDQPLADAAE
jgi:HPr kinase/phosphorylase